MEGGDRDDARRTAAERPLSRPRAGGTMNGSRTLRTGRLGDTATRPVPARHRYHGITTVQHAPGPGTGSRPLRRVLTFGATKATFSVGRFRVSLTLHFVHP